MKPNPQKSNSLILLAGLLLAICPSGGRAAEPAAEKKAASASAAEKAKAEENAKAEANAKAKAKAKKDADEAKAKVEYVMPEKSSKARPPQRDPFDPEGGPKVEPKGGPKDGPKDGPKGPGGSTQD